MLTWDQDVVINGRSRGRRTSRSCISSHREKWLTSSVSPSTLPALPITSKEEPKDTRISHTRTSSLLREKGRPSTAPPRNYEAVIEKNKKFELECKIMMGPSLPVPNNESFHGFLLGARYTSANYVDSFSVKKHGLYVPKRPFNSFIIPPHKSSHSAHGKSPSRKKWNRINSGSKCSSNPSNNTITTHSTTHVIPHEDLLTISMAPESKRPTVKDMGLKDTSLPEEAPVGNDATPLSSSEGVDVATDDPVREDASRGSPREPSKEPPRRPSPREPPREPSPREPSPREPPREPPGEECESDFISLEARELTSQILLEAQLTASASNGDLYHDATPIVREDTPRGPPRGPSPRGPPRGPSPRGPPREPSPRGPPRGPPREPSREPPRGPSPREPPREPSPREPSSREPPREPPGEECESDFISLEARELTSQILLEAQLTVSASNGDLYHDATPIEHSDDPVSDPHLDTTASEGNIMETTTYTVNTTMSTKSSTIIIDMSSLTAGGEESDY